MEVIHKREDVTSSQPAKCSSTPVISVQLHATPAAVMIAQHMRKQPNVTRQAQHSSASIKSASSAAMTAGGAASMSTCSAWPLQQHSAFMRAWSSRVHGMLLSHSPCSTGNGSLQLHQQNRRHTHTCQAGEGSNTQVLPTSLNTAVVGAALAQQWHTRAIIAADYSVACRTTAVTAGTPCLRRGDRATTPRMFERLQQVLADRQHLVDGVMPQHWQVVAMQQTWPGDGQPTLVDNRTAVVADAEATAPAASSIACNSIMLQQQAQHAEKLVNKCSVQSSSKHTEPCCVCLDDIAINDLVPLLGCGHRIHKPCLVRWLVQQGQQQKEQQPGIICPTCRQLSVDRKQLQFQP